MQYKLQMDAGKGAGADRVVVARARNHVEFVEWSAEDGTRTEHDFLCRAVETAINAGATTINIPDTVGYTTPQEYRALFEMVRARVPNSDKAIFSVHCHDDLGMAVANSIAGVCGGARQIECTINGIGERAGNAALEEIVMALRTRADVLPFTNNIETTLLTRASKLVSAVTSFPVQYNKAIVGRNAFAHESGIHQDGMLKNAHTYEIMTPETVGVSKTSLVMGKHSGRHAFKEKLKELGYDLGENGLEVAFTRFKDLADRKKIVYDEDIAALVDDEIASSHERIKVVALTVIAGTKGPQSAALTLDIDGVQQTHQATGNGPVDAIFNAIRALAPHDAKLELFQVHAVTEGTDAQAEVSVRLSENGTVVSRQGRGSGHSGRLGARLCRGAQQDCRQARTRSAGGDRRDIKTRQASACGVETAGRAFSSIKAEMLSRRAPPGLAKGRQRLKRTCDEIGGRKWRPPMAKLTLPEFDASPIWGRICGIYAISVT